MAIQYLSESEKKMSHKFKKNGFIMGNGMLTPNNIKRNLNVNLLIDKLIIEMCGD